MQIIEADTDKMSNLAVVCYVSWVATTGGLRDRGLSKSEDI